MSDRTRIEDQAANWLIRQEEPGWTEQDAAELSAWLEQSPAHKAEFWRLDYAWRQADRISALGSAALGVTPHEVAPGHDTAVLDGAEQTNVIAFPARSRWTESRPRARATFAALAGLVIVGSTLFMLHPHWPKAFESLQLATLGKTDAPVQLMNFETGTGMLKHVTLPDGSRIELNTETKMKASLETPSREVWLERGEAYFDIRHASDQPFVIHAGRRRITVLGTKFSVLREGDEVKVSVLEGRVRVEDLRPDAPLPVNIVKAGDTVLARSDSALVAQNEQARVLRDLSWRNGVLTFDQTGLGDAAEQFNRYNTRQIRISDPATAAIRIGGTFKTDNVEAFVRLLHDAYGVKVEEHDDLIVISN